MGYKHNHAIAIAKLSSVCSAIVMGIDERRSVFFMEKRSPSVIADHSVSDDAKEGL